MFIGLLKLKPMYHCFRMKTILRERGQVDDQIFFFILKNSCTSLLHTLTPPRDTYRWISLYLKLKYYSIT